MWKNTDTPICQYLTELILQGAVNNIYPGPVSLASLSSHPYVQRI